MHWRKVTTEWNKDCMSFLWLSCFFIIKMNESTTPNSECHSRYDDHMWSRTPAKDCVVGQTETVTVRTTYLRMFGTLVKDTATCRRPGQPTQPWFLPPRRLSDGIFALSEVTVVTVKLSWCLEHVGCEVVIKELLALWNMIPQLTSNITPSNVSHLHFLFVLAWRIGRGGECHD